ncbi:hypothetical protein RJ639_003723 [Escallonia herrerae]|uniref:Ubiquitin-like domain-containing protein n=1 Tax=Escallonia herrerae TaxID=1293975 RepID=A0AA89AWW3_9ASTE|nr:hypothetical protein RJ639_003723 [Escallonia herrerae]
MEEGGDATDPQCSITISVKFSGRSIPITLPPDSTVKHLKSLLQPLTNVLPRGQKLISKGKLLVDDMTLRSSEVSHGSKIMLMASQGLHQGDGPIKKEAPAVSNLRRMAEVIKEKKEKPDIAVEKSQLERWKATGVVALSACNLKAIPQEVWTCGASARVLDLSHNSIQHVPAAVGSLSSLQKLFLNANDVPDEAICWEAVSSLKSLTVLSLSQNQYWTSKDMPVQDKYHSHVYWVLHFPCRGMTLGAITPLAQAPLESIVRYTTQCLFQPKSYYKGACQLSTLDLHGTEITMDLLRQFEGWESFDKRRRLKHQKQLAFRVEGSAAFDEGADKN